MNIIYRCRQRIFEDLYWFRLNKLDKRYYLLRAEWNKFSKKCYELEQQLRPICLTASCYLNTCEMFPTLQKYRKVCIKAEKLKNMVMAAEKEREMFIKSR